MTMDQASVYMQQTSVSALRQKVSNGRIPKNCVKHIGGSVYIDRVAIDEWISGQ